MKPKEKPMDYGKARDLLLSRISSVGAEWTPLFTAAGRVLAEDVAAAENVPAFDRSPYDGYALRAEDTAAASRENPVTLKILEEIPAGATPTQPVTPGTASKILTGAPISVGADAVINFEATEFTAETVTLFAPVESGSNIVRAGEDVKRGTILLRKGQMVDAGAAGVLAAQGITEPLVYRKPKIAVLSTGSELVEANQEVGPGRIRNSNAYTLSIALAENGLEAVYLGIAGDSVGAISGLLDWALDSCDGVVATGGVSVGDYDLTPAAMEKSGVETLFRGVALKPGMACAYGMKDGKPVCALSGNPASALTNFYAIALPTLKALAGRNDPVPETFPVCLADGFRKASRGTRLLRGKLRFREGVCEMELPWDQGNVVISSAIGCDAMAIVPAGSGPLEAGTVLDAFLL